MTKLGIFLFCSLPFFTGIENRQEHGRTFRYTFGIIHIVYARHLHSVIILQILDLNSSIQI